MSEWKHTNVIMLKCANKNDFSDAHFQMMFMSNKYACIENNNSMLINYLIVYLYNIHFVLSFIENSSNKKTHFYSKIVALLYVSDEYFLI